MKKKMKYISVLGLSLLILTACSEKETTNDNPFKDLVVNEEDLKEETVKEDVVLDEKDKEMIEHNQKNYEEAIEEYEKTTGTDEVGEVESVIYNEDGTYKDNILVFEKLDEFDKWDAMHLLDLLNVYHDYYIEKDLLIESLYTPESLSGSEMRENSDLNDIILELDNSDLYKTEITDENLNKLYTELKTMHKKISDLAHIENNVNENFININQYNAYKTEYNRLEQKILTAIGLNEMMTADDFRYYHE